MIRRMTQYLSLGLCLVIGLGFLPVWARGAPAMAVIVDEVSKASFNETQDFIGRFVSPEGGDIAATVAGPVQRVDVSVGDTVQVNDRIAQIDDTQFKLEVDLSHAKWQAEKAALSLARNQYKQAMLNLNRQRALEGSPGYSTALVQDLELASISANRDITIAKAKLKEAENHLKLKELNLKRTSVIAPFSGFITIKHVQPGAYVTVGEPIVKLQSIETIEVEVEVPGQLAKQFENGSLFVAHIEGQNDFNVQLRAIILEENPLSRTLALRLLPVEPRDTKWVINQTVIVKVPLGKKKAVLSVHKDALISSQQGFYVFVVDGMKAQMRRVELGQAMGDRMEVISGLKEQDKVVVRGNERLRPGQAVSIGNP